MGFEWPSTAAVPIPEGLSHQMRKFWPLAKSASLPFVSAIPNGLRTKLFARYYLQNQLMVEGLAESGKYSVYIDGCKGPCSIRVVAEHNARHSPPTHRQAPRCIPLSFSQSRRFAVRAAPEALAAIQQAMPPTKSTGLGGRLLSSNVRIHC